MTQLKSIVRAYQKVVADELKVQVKLSDGSWHPDTWNILYGVIYDESTHVQDASVAGTTRYSQAVKLLGDYLETEPTPYRVVLLYWDIEYDLFRLNFTLSMMTEYVLGQRKLVRGRTQRKLSKLCTELAFSPEQMVALDAASRICIGYQKRFARFRKIMSHQQALALDSIAEDVEDERAELFIDNQWASDTFSHLFRLLRRERMLMRGAAPFSVKYYSEVLKIFAEYLVAKPHRLLIRRLHGFVSFDLEKLQEMLVHPLPFSTFEKELLDSSKEQCDQCLTVLKKRLDTW